jgi:twinfilin
MPGYSCSIKERMMYSSSKAPFLDTIANLGVFISKKVHNKEKKLNEIFETYFVSHQLFQLEIDNGLELTEQYLMDELHPKQFLHRTQFSKPKGPPNRGAKRLTKTVDEEK